MSKNLEQEIKDMLKESANRPNDKDAKFEADKVVGAGVDTNGPKPTDGSHEEQQGKMKGQAKKAADLASKDKGRKADKDNKLEVDKLPVGGAKEEAKEVPAAPAITELSDHMKKLFDGETLSEDFKTKATAIFESAVNERVNVAKGTIEADYTAKLDTNTKDIEKNLSEKVDNYLTFVTEEWVKENKLALESSLRTEFAEEFITGLKGLFESFYVDIPEGKEDLLATTTNKVTELEKTLKEATEKNAELVKSISMKDKAAALTESLSGLVETDKDKLSKLAEGLEFTTLENYREKLKVLKESHFGKKAPENDKKDINEATHTVADTSEAAPQTNMDRYVSAISKMKK